MLDAIVVAIGLIPTATWSSLTGVLVAGAITFFVHRLNFRRLRKLVEKDKRKRDLASRF
jgi:HAMP domain-containing protein